jgi:hypothetical protein
MAVIGREGIVRYDTIKVAVRVLDVKTSYGCTRYLIAPIAGGGEAWIDAARFEGTRS